MKVYNKLSDTPWHVGYTKKDENDPRRHKARCATVQFAQVN